MSLVNGEGIALMLDLDDCNGCFGCEAACRETHRYPYDEDWMRVERRACYDNDPNPLCVSGCPTRALKIGPFVEIAKEAEGRHCAIFTA